MELKAIVKYQGALAHYNISPENQGIFQAKLIRYDGKPERTPPQKVTLIRGYRHWSGSCERRELLDELGSTIERKLKNKDLLFPDPGKPLERSDD